VLGVVRWEGLQTCMQAFGVLSAQVRPRRECVSVCACVWTPPAVWECCQWPVVIRRRVLGPCMRACMSATVAGSRTSTLAVFVSVVFMVMPVCLCLQGPTACTAFRVCQSLLGRQARALTAACGLSAAHAVSAFCLGEPPFECVPSPVCELHPTISLPPASPVTD